MILENLLINADYHSHTKYSHGKGTILDNYEMASAKGIKYLAITDHGLDHMIFGLRESDLPKMRKEIDDINASSLSTKVLLGIEMNFKGENGEIDYPRKYPGLLDIVVCGYHKTALPSSIKDAFKIFVPSLISSKWQTKRQKTAATKMYINAIKKYKIDIISHINREIKTDVLEIAKVAEEYGTYLELSSRHCDLTDDEYDQIFNKTNVKFVLNSDAHKVNNIGKVDFALSIIKKFNVPIERIDNIGNRFIKLRSHNFTSVENLFK